MADKLTPQQAQAVNDRGGNLLVSAAAGSGKTKVLVDRLMRYLTDPKDPADLDQFLIITYTKAAASELRGKIAAKLAERIAQEPENRHLQRQMQRLFLTKISTVHGFCGDLLREYAYQLDIAGDFRVADENECRELRETVLADILDAAYEKAGEDPYFRAFVDTQGLGRDDRLVPEIIQQVYDSARCHMDPAQWLDRCCNTARTEALTDAGQTVWGRFLMDGLFEELDRQISVMEQCVRQAERSEGMEKPLLNLKNTLHQLIHLRQSQTWDDIITRKELDYGKLVFPKKNCDLDLAERIKAARNSCKDILAKKLKAFAALSAQTLEDLTQSADAVKGMIGLVRQFDRAYAQAKRSRRCLDFSDLEHKTLDLVLGKKRAGPTTVAREIGARFREIMVDEYQDSNGVQDAIFSALTGMRNNCFMVGDVKQSIYQFRLADPGIFLEKYREYVPAEEAAQGQGRKVLLSSNFRSGCEIIDAVNQVFTTCMTPGVGGLNYTQAEALQEGIPRDALPDPAVELHMLEVSAESYDKEATFVADRICQMLDGGTLIRKNGGLEPVTAEDIVILLRSPGPMAIHFQRALAARGIRCASGGSGDILRTQEIATLRSLLQTISNPRQDIPLLSVLASPVFGFTADDLAVIRAGQRKMPFYDALLSSDHPKAEKFLDILKQLRMQARMDTLTRLLEGCFALTRLDSIYGAMEEGQNRLENLQVFYRVAADFESAGHSGLARFLEHLDALEEKGLARSGDAAVGCVTIMSIHKSKGLEFPVVFLCGLSRSFNQESLRARILCDKELGLGLSVADKVERVRYPTLAKRAIAAKMAADSLSEELRVLYVAMTRARDRLVMTYTARNLKKKLPPIALGMDYDRELVSRDVSCPGDWVLMAALYRTEAGQLFAQGGKPLQTQVSRYPWTITVTQGGETVTESVETTQQAEPMPEGTEEALARDLSFRYDHAEATRMPSKQTATGWKGRIKDAEAAQDAQTPKTESFSFRRPSFRQDQPWGKVYGNAVHAVMQYIRYRACSSLEGVQRELIRLGEEGYLTQDQMKLVKPEQIYGFFQTEIGEKLLRGTDYVREFKFSILVDADRCGPGLQGEKVLLQGVVDCALLEPDGITVVDLKTDHVTRETLPKVVERYRQQVEIYADALGRIYENRIKGKYLYFFRLGIAVAI